MIDRRRFIDLGLRGVLLFGLGGLGRKLAASEAPPAGGGGAGGPTVLEVIRRSVPVSQGLDEAEAGVLLDEMIGRLTGMGPEEYPLDIWASLFPAEMTAGIKVDGSAEGEISPVLAKALAGRIVAADVPPENVLVWDRDSRPRFCARQGSREGQPSPACLAVKDSGGYGRPVQPRDGAPGREMRSVRLARVAERITRQCTVTALGAARDGAMAPFAIENLAFGASTTGRKARAAAGDGALAARIASDPALLSRAGMHLADLWNVPLGDDSSGRAQVWEAETILAS